VDELDTFRWLAEPDPAVIRAGLVGALAHQHGLRPLAPQIAYLGGDAASESPFLRCWEVLDRCRADEKRVRALLSKHGIGPVTVKKRGHPQPADVLERRFRGRGTAAGLVCVFRGPDGHRALLLRSQAPD